MASPNQIGDNTLSVDFTVPSESITLPESFYDLSESLERYSQSPTIDLPDPRYQFVMSDVHSEADHDEGTSSAFTPEQLACIQELIQAHAAQSSTASGSSLPTTTTTSASAGNLGKSSIHQS